MRLLLLVLAALALAGLGVGLSIAAAPGEHVACATATVPAQTVAANGNVVGTIPGAGDVQCVTATDQTVTGPTTTVTQTVTTGGTTTTSPPPPPPPPPPPACSQSADHPFPCDSLWNTSLPASPALDPNSTAKIAYLRAHNMNSPSVSNHNFGSAVATGRVGTDPAYNVVCTSGSCNLTQYGAVPIPTGTRPDPSSDGHLAVFDPNRFLEFDFWISKCPADCGHTSGGGAFDAAGTGVGKTSAGQGVAARVPMLPGLLRPADITRGVSDHALEGSVAGGAANYHICPATAHDGSDANASAIPEGTLLQLDPSLVVDALVLPDWQKAVARSLQTYGMYVIDQGGSFTIKAQSFPGLADPWAAFGMSATYPNFAANFPWASLRVLSPRTPWC